MTDPVTDLSNGTVTVDDRIDPAQAGLDAPDETPDAQPSYDPVTGLPNRFLFLDRLSKAITTVQRDGRMTGILVIALDRNGGKSRAHGSEHGEAVKRIATRLLDNLRGTDTVARLGDNSFGVIQFGVRHADDCFALCRRLEKLFAKDDDAEAARALPTIGAAIAASDRDPPEAWLRRAEAAVREGSQRQCNFADPVHQARWKDRLNAERDIWQALREEQFELHYLPLVQPLNRRIIGLEALVRWRHPQRGLLPPAAFLPVAEACGQMGDIGRWVLRRACTDAAAWPSSLLQVMVNISVAQFRQSDLLSDITDALGAANLDPERLVLEIGEDVLFDTTDRTVPVLNSLRSKGISVALDDFGTGRSSLNVLQWFAFDRLKIDQRLMAETTRHPAAASMVRAIIAMGRAMGVRIAAKGVDSQEKLDLLLEEGCEEVQGFYFGRPMPNQDLHRMIELIDAHQSRPIWSNIAQEAAAASA